MLIAKIMLAHTGNDEHPRAIHQIITGFREYKFVWSEDNRQHHLDLIYGVWPDQQTRTIWLRGNVYVMNEAGKTIQVCNTTVHRTGCAVYNDGDYDPGACDCGATADTPRPEVERTEDDGLLHVTVSGRTGIGKSGLLKLLDEAMRVNDLTVTLDRGAREAIRLGGELMSTPIVLHELNVPGAQKTKASFLGIEVPPAPPPPA